MMHEQYTPEIMVKAIRKSGGVIAEAARMIGCSRNTLKKYRDEYPEVKEALDEENEINLDGAESRLIAFVEGTQRAEVNGDRLELPLDPRVQLDALKFYLRTIGRRRGYGDHLELAGDKENPLPPIQVQIINAQHMENK